ncbi:SDR family oxidoreductase [Sinorhizobium sp. 8-89]|uniref:SDR family oxidoreductase n=1 Tax=Sinorhizobium sp. 7-81 TaxID=3049087 RepID=UPI0024C2BA20|nr:SDR family oxidoreductase [Sinorhizobium sp. 7-81]MDK1386558.1 SDR family oxidoreductase [Sinorhizobium sp. 7-81]
MTNILILGASGQIARWVVKMFGQDTSVNQTLLVRDASKVDAPANARVVQGDVLDKRLLEDIMTGQDVIYANLAGDVDKQAEAIISAMRSAGVNHLIFVTSLGIYDEVPGEFGAWNRREIGSYLPPYRRAADAIEASGLDYAILRPAWLMDTDEVSYETTERREPFKGTEVSRKSVAALVTKLIADGTPLGNRNLGVSKPGTDGKKPSFI